MELIDAGNISLRQPIVATIGFFDGVHLGHRYLIEQVKSEAKKAGLPSAAITFPIHPRKVLNKVYQPALLCTYEEKIELLASTGIDYCISLNFTLDMAQLSAGEFMENVLKKQLCVATLIIGYDHKFGRNRLDDFSNYRIYGENLGINIIQAKEYNPSEHISSSHIRNLLEEGNVAKSAEYLSYPYALKGKVIEGFKIGRTIGFPTANIQVEETCKIIPALGVYAVKVYIENEEHYGMLYTGKRPTLQNGEHISLEVNIFDFERNIYDKAIKIEFIRFIRHDKKFSDIEKLKQQLTNDRSKVKSLFYL